MSEDPAAVDWLRLDNAAKIYPAYGDNSAPPVFRVAVTLKEPIQIAALNRSLARIIARTPYYQVRLRRGFFWYYLERHARVPTVELLDPLPVKQISMRSDTHLLSVQARESTVAVDFCHILTDGYGAMRFLGSLVVDYLRSLGHAVSPGEHLLEPADKPDPAEYEDAYRNLFRKEAPKAPDLPPAYHIPGLPRHEGYRTVTATLPLADALATAKKYQATLTEYLVAAYMASIAEVHDERQHRLVRSPHHIIRIEVPVNMRRLYPSNTMRNFSLFVSPEIDLRLGEFSFTDIVQRVHHSMNMQVHPTELARQIARNVGGELNPLVRVIPRPVKYLYLKYLTHTIGSRSYSGVLSNLGRFLLPEEAAPYVRAVDFRLGPNSQQKTNCSVVSYQDNLYVTFGSTIENRDVERGTVRQFVKDGLSVTVTEHAL